MRVYLGALRSDLVDLVGAEEVSRPLDGFAATSALVAEIGLEGEELETALAEAAAEASRQECVEAGEDHGRRIVLVAELADSSVTVTSAADGTVHVPAGLTRERVDAVLADAAAGDLTGAPDEALAWFATQEIGDLV